MPASTSRLARSSTSSVTCVCWSAGLSNVEYTTSAAATVRCQSVTSSGRSSTSSTITCVSGSAPRMPPAICFSTVVFPAFGGETTIPRWPFPMGATRSMIRSVMSFGSCSRRNRSSGNSGVSLSKSRPLPRGLGVDAVDGLDLEQRVVLLVVARRADLPGDLVAVAQREPADLQSDT